MLLLGYARVHYDIPTVFFWTLALVFIVRQNHIAYMVLFPFICLNRVETIPLLIILYWLRFPNKWAYLLYQGVIFILMWYGLHTYFAGNPGDAVWTEPWENVLRFWHSPWRTLVHFLVTVVILFRIVQRADFQPLYFQRVFIVLAPLFVVLYFVCGQAFETRVFWELWPIIATLIVL